MELCRDFRRRVSSSKGFIKTYRKNSAKDLCLIGEVPPAGPKTRTITLARLAEAKTILPDTSTTLFTFINNHAFVFPVTIRSLLRRRLVFLSGGAYTNNVAPARGMGWHGAVQCGRRGRAWSRRFTLKALANSSPGFALKPWAMVHVCLVATLKELRLTPCSLKSHLQRAKRVQSEALFDWQRSAD